MALQIRPYTAEDLDAIVALSLLAWEPIFVEWEKILGPDIYQMLYPDWRALQGGVVARICQDTAKITTLVADVDGAVAGFLCYQLHEEDRWGEIELLAVHPAYQNHEIGTTLNNHALDAMRAAGMIKAEVGTGGDPAHAPARRAYEKAGFTGLPLVRYYQKL